LLLPERKFLVLPFVTRHLVKQTEDFPLKNSFLKLPSEVVGGVWGPVQ
jgi:hypothetical protein